MLLSTPVSSKTDHKLYVLQDFSRPEPCSYLQAGQEFDGTQRVSQAPANVSEDWGVQVLIEVSRPASAVRHWMSLESQPYHTFKRRK